MAKARITSNVGEGLYGIELEYDSGSLDSQIEALKQQLIDIEQIVLDARVAVFDAEDVRDELADDLDDAIDAYAAGEDSAPVIAATTALAESVAQLNAARFRLQRISGQKLSLAARKTQLENTIVGSQAAASDQVWCADYSTDLAAGTSVPVAIPPGEIGPGGEPWVILPQQHPDGYGGSYSRELHGQLVPRLSMTPAATFYNWAVLPGWQRWMPTHRIGTLTFVDKANNTCNVTLDTARSTAGPWPFPQGLNVNLAESTATLLEGVPIRYMFCNASVFESGDRVLVRFAPPSAETAGPVAWDDAEVIGFVSDPRPCGGPLTFIVGNDGSDFLRNTPIGEGRQYLYRGPSAPLEENENYYEGLLDSVGIQAPWESGTAQQLMKMRVLLSVVFGEIFGAGRFVTGRPSVLSSSPLVAITGCALWSGHIYACTRAGRAFLRPFDFYDPADNGMYDEDTNPTGWIEITIDRTPLDILNTGFPFFVATPHPTEQKFLAFGREDREWEMNPAAQRPHAYHVFELTIERIVHDPEEEGEDPVIEYVGEWATIDTLDATIPGSHTLTSTINSWDDPGNTTGTLNGDMSYTVAETRSGQLVHAALYDRNGDVMIVRSEFSWTRNEYFERSVFFNHVAEPLPWLLQPGPIYTDGGAESAYSRTLSGSQRTYFGNAFSIETWFRNVTESETAETTATHHNDTHIPTGSIRPGSYDRTKSFNVAEGIHALSDTDRQDSVAHSDPRSGLLKLNIRGRTTDRTDAIAMSRDEGGPTLNAGTFVTTDSPRFGSTVISNWSTIQADATVAEDETEASGAGKGPRVEFSESAHPHIHTEPPAPVSPFSESGLYATTGLPFLFSLNDTVGWTESANNGRGDMLFSAAGSHAGLSVREDIAVWAGELVNVFDSLPDGVDPIDDPEIPRLLGIGAFDSPLPFE